MSNLAKLRTKYGENIGVELFVEFPDISSNEKSFFDADEASGQTALSASGTNFAANDYVVLGTPRVEKSEIVKLSGTSATTLTSGATVFAHSRGDAVQFIPYNQIVVERSTDSGSTYTPLSAVDIRPDASETYIARTGDASTDVYRFRFYNSTSGLYSAYSDSFTASGLADNTVGAIKQRALDDLGEIKGEVPWTQDAFLNQSLWTARREVDEDERILRWSFREKFNQDIGDCIPGRWSLSVPIDLRDSNTNKNILGLRIGRLGQPLAYLDANQFFYRYRNVAHTTLATQVTSASTSIVLTSSGDFDESGTVYFAAESISGTVDSAAYTANTESSATLGTVTGITNTHAAGRDVWQGVTFGRPTYYTIFQGLLYFDVPFNDDLAGENIFMDYYSTLLAYDSDADVLDEPEIDLFVAYLRYKIKYKKSNGALNYKEDPDFAEWDRKKTALINKQITGQIIQFVPDYRW